MPKIHIYTKKQLLYKKYTYKNSILILVYKCTQTTICLTEIQGRIIVLENLFFSCKIFMKKSF